MDFERSGKEKFVTVDKFLLIPIIHATAWLSVFPNPYFWATRQTTVIVCHAGRECQRLHLIFYQERPCSSPPPPFIQDSREQFGQLWIQSNILRASMNAAAALYHHPITSLIPSMCEFSPRSNAHPAPHIGSFFFLVRRIQNSGGGGSFVRIYGKVCPRRQRSTNSSFMKSIARGQVVDGQGRRRVSVEFKCTLSSSPSLPIPHRNAELWILATMSEWESSPVASILLSSDTTHSQSHLLQLHVSYRILCAALIPSAFNEHIAVCWARINL